MSDRITIKEATIGDVKGLHAFLSDLTNERLPVLYYRDQAPTLEETRELIARISGAPRSVLLVAEVEGRVVGMLDFHGGKGRQRAHMGEFGMSVDKLWRHRGVGTLLVDHVVKWAVAQGIRRIEIEVFATNKAAIGLYEKFGFLCEGQKVDAVEVDGAYVDVVIMAKHLPQERT